jgi:ABC-type uncharacterized transport system auxiliary subunit
MHEVVFAKEQVMKKIAQILRAGCIAFLAAAALAACTTVNKFDSYRVEGSTVAVSMMKPPQPSMDVNYNVTIDAHNPVLTAISVGTNIAKANEAAKVAPMMRDALSNVDVPGIVLKEAYTACLAALDAYGEENKFAADYLLSLDIEEYGIHAHSYSGEVTLSIDLTARLFHNASGELVWRRDFSMRKAASPVMFGFGNEVVGTIISAAALSNLSQEDLEDGFERLAEDAARSIARTLEDDIYNARFQD